MQITGMAQAAPAGNENKSGAAGITSVFDKLAPGQHTQVEVVEVSDGKLTLKTAEGELVQADYPKDSGILPGDVLELTLVSKGEGRTQLRLTAIGGQTVNLEANELQSFLMNMGVQPSEGNIRAARFLLDRNVLPTAEKISALLKIADRFPRLEASVALFMAENDVPPTERNVQVLQRWFSNPQTLGDTARELSGLLEQFAADGQSAGEKTVFTERFLNHAAIRSAQDMTRQIAPEALRNLAQRLAGLGEGQAKALVREFVTAVQTPPEQKAVLTALLMGAYDAANNTRAVPDTVRDTPAAPPDLAREQAAAAPDGQAGGEINRSGVSLDGEIQKNAAGGERAALAEQNVKNPVPQEQIAQQPQSGAQAAREAKEIIRALDRLFVPIGRGAENAAVLRQAVKGQQALAEIIREGAAGLVGENGYLTQRAGEMSSQIRVGSELNNFYYCQIPFEAGQDKNTAELYVFERNHEKRQGERTRLTVLIALETQYMGRVESVLRAENETLSVELRVESDRVERFLREAAKELEKELEGSEFQVVGIDVRRIRTPITPLNAAQALGSEEPAARVEGIDIRI